MPHFIVFVSNRFMDVERHVAQFNDTRHTIEFCFVREATTRELGRAAFAHHLVWPLHVLIVVPSVLDLFTWDDELHLYIPFFVTPDAAVAAFEADLQLFCPTGPLSAGFCGPGGSGYPCLGGRGWDPPGPGVSSRSCSTREFYY